MQLQNFYAQDSNGNTMPLATGMLYMPGTTTLATGLQDATGAPLSNPFSADTKGLISIAAPNGYYDLVINAGTKNGRLRVMFIDVDEVAEDAATASDAATVAQAAAAVATSRTASFLAPRSVAPTVRDDGSALQVGDRYVNTSTQVEYIYKSGGWASNESLDAVTTLGSQVDAIEADLDDSKEYQASGSGSTVITVKSKLALLAISVEEFGALGGATDDSAAFQSAIDALPTNGGVISAKRSAYTVNTAPNHGTKSIVWDFGPNTLISGSQTTFPRFATNGSCSPVGPYVRSQTAGPTIDGAASFAYAIESIQPASDTNNGYGALFLGAQLNADGAYSITSALNAVSTANPGSSGNIFGAEIDVATFADAGKGTQFGLLISGAGGNDVTFGIRINRHGTSEKYLYGIAMVSARIGLFVDDSQGGLENGLVLGNPPSRYANNMIQAMQISNGGSVLLMQRKTNTSPTGNFISAINANNTQQLFAVDILGQLVAQRVEAPYLKITGAAVAQVAGQISIGAATSTSATAGGIAVPATASGFFNWFNGVNPVKVAFYAP